MGRRASSAEQIDDEGDGRQVREKKKNLRRKKEERRERERERERMKCLFNERRERSFFFVFF